MNQLPSPFVHVQKTHELTSIAFCTRAKSPWTNFKAFLHTCKTVLQTFKDLLFTTQNRPASVQTAFVHAAKPSCKRSSPFCSWCKNVLQTFKDWLFTLQALLKKLQRSIVYNSKPLCKCSVCWYLNDFVRTSYWSKELFECKHCAFLFFDDVLSVSCFYLQ